MLFAACFAWAWSTPIFAPPDEQAHATRAAVIARGDFFGRKDVDTGVFGVLSEVSAPKWLGRFDPGCFIAHTNVTPDCVRTPAAAKGDKTYLIFMGAYGPWYSLGEGLVTLGTSGRTAIYLMRLLSALACSALLAGAFVSAQRLGRWAVVGVAAAMTPMALYLAATVNPNGVEIASAIAIWAGAVALARARKIDERLLARTAIAFTICINTRGLSLPIGVVAFAVPLLLASRPRLSEILRLRRAAVWIGLAVLGVIVSAGWSALNGIKDDSLVHVPFTVIDGVERSWRLYVGSIAVFGWSEVKVPAVALIWGVVLIGLVVLALMGSSRRETAVLGTAALIAFFVPTIISILQPPPIHVAWYGRYGLPMWVGVPVLAGALIATRRSPRVGHLSPPLARASVPVVAALLGTAQVAAFAVAARRYVTGYSGPILYVFDPAWSPPVPPVLLLVWVAIAITGVAWMVTRVPVGDHADWNGSS